MAQRAPRLRVGAPAYGRDYHVSGSVEREVIGAVEDRRGVLVTGPRRSGKSSLVRHVAEVLETRGHSARVVDLQGLRTPLPFIAAISDFADTRRRGLMLGEGELLRNSNSEAFGPDAVTALIEEATRGTGTDVLLLDEAGTVLAHDPTGRWVAAIGAVAQRSARDGPACVLTAEMHCLRAVLDRLPQLAAAINRLQHIRLRPWTADVVETYVADRGGRNAPERVRELVASIAPGWPMEVAAATRMAFAYGPHAGIEEAVARVAEEGVAGIANAVEIARAEEHGATALRLLEALAASDAPIGIDALAEAVRQPARRILPAVQTLEDLGLVARELNAESEPSRVRPATPLTARQLRRLFGHGG